MNAALETLGLDADQLTTENLKTAFKAAALRSHPDKGGADFDDVIQAYVFLSQVIRRQTGGRNGFVILDPREVEQARQEQFERELNNMVMDVMDSMDSMNSSSSTISAEAFHAAFERLHVSDHQHGYGQWMKGLDDAERDSTPMDPAERYEMYMRDPYAAHWLKGEEVPMETTVHGVLDHDAFEASHAPAGVMTLHLGEMATYSRPMGTLLIQERNQPFEPSDQMGYADLHAAYGTDAIIRDKLPRYRELCSFEELKAARMMELAPQTDVEMEELAAYEKRREAKEAEHQTRITDYFAAAPSSQWALPKSSGDSFIKTL